MALTLPSSNGVASFLSSVASSSSSRPDNIQLNARFNGGGLTQTTSTLTPTRLKNIQEAFLLEQQNQASQGHAHHHLPPRPFQHEHMAGFVTPAVNISLFVRPQHLIPQQNHSQLHHQAHLQNHFDNSYNSSTNSNDSYVSEDYSRGSSEENSSAVENSLHSFNNLIVDMNSGSSSSSKCSQNQQKSNQSKMAPKSRVTKAKAAAPAQRASTSQQAGGQAQKPARKSTGGGRKPTKIDKLTPEEAQKREKRRERNKLAAARCRKRRLDQTNTLTEKTSDLEKHHEDLVEDLQKALSQMNTLKRFIEMHERLQCKKSFRQLPSDLFGAIDFDALQEAMKPLKEEEDDGFSDSDDDAQSSMSSMAPHQILNHQQHQQQPQIKAEFLPGMPSSSATSVIVTSSNANPNILNIVANAAQHIQQQQLQQQQHHQFLTSSSASSQNILEQPINATTSSNKRKRPNTLPVSSSYNKPDGVSSSALQTPSNGMFDMMMYESTGLTPLMPTITPSGLMTPSTMAAFMKTLASPTEESDSSKKKLLII